MQQRHQTYDLLKQELLRVPARCVFFANHDVPGRQRRIVLSTTAKRLRVVLYVARDLIDRDHVET